MNQPSQQLTKDFNVTIAYDQPLSPLEMKKVVMSCIGEKCTIEEILGKKVLLFNTSRKPIILLCKAVTYLGNPHPIFKKRIQIPKEWIEYTNKAITAGYDVRFLGVYHYDDTIVYCDFVKDTYLNHNCNSSAVHVYINDLYQGLTQKTFSKLDKNGNRIVTISPKKLRGYLEGNASYNKLFELFAQFNSGFNFGEWLTAVESIEEMHDKAWSQWKQAEWAGWFLEYKFSRFANEENVKPYMQYTALSNKGKDDGKFDFDIWFPKNGFYGDLKASDISKMETPGNDQGTFVECLEKYGKFWYVIYEHETIKDSSRGFEATIFRNHYKRRFENIPDEDFDEMSYHKRMKHSVKFVKMCIIEINQVNCQDLFKEFRQGHQPSGATRLPKFVINKRNIDNYVVYRYQKQGL